MESDDKLEMIEKDSISPDHELILWEKWIQIRKEEAIHLAEKTDRAPADLTMNLLEKVREDKERKTVLEHAQLARKPVIRGALWEQQQRLKQRFWYDPVYEIQRTPAEKGRPRVIEHIGVPEYIQQTEKGIFGTAKRKPCPQLDKDYIDYRDKRETELKESIKKIDPYRPDIRGLMIKGNKPKPPPRKLPPLPEIKISEVIDDPFLLNSIFSVRINNTLFVKNIQGQNLSNLWRMQKESWHEPCTFWSYYFNAPVSRVGRSKLYLENLGTVTLRYCWKKIKRPIPYIPEDIYEQVFYFNKNEDVLPPGQSTEIIFTFISSKPGIYSESWELNMCNISFFDTLGDRLIINLQGDSVENFERTNCKVEFIKGRINRKAMKNIARSILNEAIEKATTIKPQTYPYKHLFLEAELFVMKNPVCFYHQTEVARMRDVYTEMAPDETWDLSITSWRQKMLEKQYEDRMKYFDILKVSHKNLLKPWYEGEELLKHKYRAVKIFLGQMADRFDEEYDKLFTSDTAEQADTADKSTMQPMQPSNRPSVDSITMSGYRNIFYIRAYKHVSDSVELCAGILSSLDLNKWIEFDFCRT